MLGTLLLFLWLPSLPEWAAPLKPQARLALEYVELRETDLDRSGLEMSSNLNVRPTLDKNWEFGAEIRTSPGGLSLERGRIGAQNGFEDFRIALSEIYIAYKTSEWRNQDLVLNFGKMSSPFFTTPLTWDSQLRPEGAYEAYLARFPDERLQIRLHAGQWNADRVQESLVNGTPLRKFWLLIQGADIRWQLSDDIEWVIAGHLYWFTTPSERIVNLSSQAGNRVVANGGGGMKLLEKYAPAEFYSELRGSPLGIPASLAGAAALNFRSEDRARGFWARLSVGNSYVKKGLEAQLEWLYLEPHLQIAYFNDALWGSANRHAGRARLLLGLSSHVRITTSFLYSTEMEQRSNQANRIEGRGGLEVKWP